MTDQDNNGRKPGPATPEGRQRISVAATKHGAWRLLHRGTLPTAGGCPLRGRCDCPATPADPCPVFARTHAEYFRSVAELPHLAGKRHLAPLIREYARNLTALDLIDSWTARVGAVRPAGNSLEYHGIWKVRWTISAEARRMAQVLAITPAEAAAIGADEPIDVGGDLLARLRQEAQPATEGGA